jgi:hypothetical protein
MEGFVSAEEEWSPFALATLRMYSLHHGDGVERHGGVSDGGAQSLDVQVVTQERCRYGPIPFQEAARQARMAEFELDSFLRGAVHVKMRDQPFRVIQELGPGFFNVRAPFLVLLGAADVGAHMSFVRLRDGRFLALGALDPNGKPNSCRQPHVTLHTSFMLLNQAMRLVSVSKGS